MPEDCIFCKIIAGQIPAQKVYEDEQFLAFLDVRPLNPGHTLVLPKAHFRWVWDVPNIGDYFTAVGKVANALRAAFGTEFVVSVIVGEGVPHAHVQLIPRFQDDGHGGAINLMAVKRIPESQMGLLAERIRKALK
jgi:histidine triad (HIT) family protein